MSACTCVGHDHKTNPADGSCLVLDKTVDPALVNTPGELFCQCAGCPECAGRGALWVGGCTCGAGDGAYGHEPGCGNDPCPNGCEYNP